MICALFARAQNVASRIQNADRSTSIVTLLKLFEVDSSEENRSGVRRRLELIILALLARTVCLVAVDGGSIRDARIELQ